MANESEKSTLTFLTESLPSFFYGVEVSFTIEAIGGIPPYNFRLREGTLPPSLNLSPAGLLSGTPEQIGYNTIMVTLRDSLGAEISQIFNVDVDDEPPRKTSR